VPKCRAASGAPTSGDETQLCEPGSSVSGSYAPVRRGLRVVVPRVGNGLWDVSRLTLAHPGHLGLLVVDGVLARDVMLEDQISVELLGAGDVIRPWHVERWIGSVRRECLDRLLSLGRRQLEHVLRVYVRHHNSQRPHPSLDLCAPASIDSPIARGDAPADTTAVHRRDLLGGLIHEYSHAA
jgi:hypothetical protein